MANALTLLVRKADAVAHVVRRTFALTLCVQKVKCPDTPRPEGRRRGARRPEGRCCGTRGLAGIIRPEGQCAAYLSLVRICTGGSRL